MSQAIALKPDHLSVYGLIYEPNTALTNDVISVWFSPVIKILKPTPMNWWCRAKPRAFTDTRCPISLFPVSSVATIQILEERIMVGVSRVPLASLEARW